VSAERGAPAARVPARLIRTRVALSAFFFINGAVLASWVAHIPAVKQGLGIGDGVLGAVLLCMAVGAVAALSIAGRLVARFGSRRVATIAATGLCLALPLPILSPTIALVGIALLVLGACNGLLDVSMNAQAVVVERLYGRPIMSSFHGLFGLGGLVGAGAAGALMWFGITPAVHVIGTAVATAVVVWLAGRVLVADPPAAPAAGARGARPVAALRWLGLLAFAALMTEGAMGDWSAVYLHDVLASSPALASTGFAAFSMMMAIGRLTGDRVVAAWGSASVLRASGVLAGAGLGAALVIGQPLAAVAGCALVGLGIANVIPILFSRAGSLRGVEPGPALAAVASTGYCGFLAGPPLIGMFAELTSLPTALGAVVAACGFIALRARSVSRS